MMVVYIVTAVLVLTGLYLLLRAAGSSYLQFRGTRIITCPETNEPAAVKVSAGYAALSSVLLDPTLRLRQCSRWPERQDCGQQCLKQIEAAPEDCLVRTILAGWYQGKACVYCHKPLGEINWLEHKPALLSPERKTVEWSELRPEAIPAVLETHRPVCWNCHIAETFREQYPDLAVDRGWRRSGEPAAGNEH